MDDMCCGGDREDQRGDPRGDLRGELWRLRAKSPDAAFLFRLCCIRLVLSGQRPAEVGAWLEASERTVRRWVDLYRRAGTEALRRGLRTGRPGQLQAEDLSALASFVHRPPAELGLGCREWNGALVQQCLDERFGVTLGLRQCQRLLSLARRAAAQGLPQRSGCAG